MSLLLYAMSGFPFDWRLARREKLSIELFFEAPAERDSERIEEGRRGMLAA